MIEPTCTDAISSAVSDLLMIHEATCSVKISQQNVLDICCCNVQSTTCALCCVPLSKLIVRFTVKYNTYCTIQQYF